MSTTKLTGIEAIKYAEAHGLLLRKHSDPTEDARDDISIDEAREIAKDDPSLLYVSAGALTEADLNGMIAIALDLDDAPSMDWERDADTDGGWVVRWEYSESVDNVAQYLRAHNDVDTSVSHSRGDDDEQPGTWLWVAPK